MFAADLDGGGDNDVLSASQIDDKVAWYENLGCGGFSNKKIITNTADGVRSVFAADINGDGVSDVLSASYWTDSVEWYQNLAQFNQAFSYQVSLIPNNSLTFSVNNGHPTGQYHLFHTNNIVNQLFPGQGWVFGMHIPVAQVVSQGAAGLQGDPLFGGTLNSNGGSSLTIPWSVVSYLSGQTWWSVAMQLAPCLPGLYEGSAV